MSELTPGRPRVATFEINAEYLHTLVGRRVVVPDDDDLGPMTITIRQVGYDPESGLVMIDADTAHGPLVGYGLAPATVVVVEHTS